MAIRPHIRTVFLAALVSLLLCTAVRAQTPPRPEPYPDLEQSIAKILPTEEENSYRRIKWYTELSDAVAEAKRQRKPIYIWLMNGHPLCDT